MRTTQAQIERYSRAFVDKSLQVNWQTATVELRSAVAGGGESLYPVIYRGGATAGYTFQNDSIIFGVSYSVTWFTAAADEAAVVALAMDSGPKLSVLGGNSILFQSAHFCLPSTTASTIQRNPGFVFPIPVVKWIQKGTTVYLYGSRQTLMAWRNLATIYFIPQPEFLRFMEQALG